MVAVIALLLAVPIASGAWFGLGDSRSASPVRALLARDKAHSQRRAVGVGRERRSLSSHRRARPGAAVVAIAPSAAVPEEAPAPPPSKDQAGGGAANAPVAAGVQASPAIAPTEAAPEPEPPSEAEPEPTPAPEPEPAPAPEPEPEPEAEPGPAPPPLFTGARIGDFWMNQSAPGAVSEVPDPAGSEATVFQMTVSDQDVYPVTPTANPRAQLTSPAILEPGAEIWWSASFFLPADFPASVPGWLNLLEGPYGPPFAGSPPWQIQVVGDQLRWTRNGTYQWDVPWQMPLVRNAWVNVLVHERFAGDGFVEMWIDGQRVTFFGGGTYNPHGIAPVQRLSMQTLDGSNNGGPNSLYLQSYREAGMFPSVTVYEGPLRIGSARASVAG